jgi:hypothetical protein
LIRASCPFIIAANKMLTKPRDPIPEWSKR